MGFAHRRGPPPRGTVGKAHPTRMSHRAPRDRIGPKDRHCNDNGFAVGGPAVTYGFKPDASGIPLWELMEILKSGDSFPGIVTDDRAVFSAAATDGLVVKSFKVLLPGPRFQDFRGRLDGERQASQYTYSYLNGGGEIVTAQRGSNVWAYRCSQAHMDEFSACGGSRPARAVNLANACEGV